jgi:hypothetical protein
MRSRLSLAALAAATLVLAGCGEGGTGVGDPSDEESSSHENHDESQDQDPPEDATDGAHGHGAAKAVKAGPLRPGEKRMTLEMPEPYTPSAPTGVGTDDYRCFLLDPHLDQDAWLTGTHVLPGNPDVVHHVILFRVPSENVADAEAKDAESEGQGWTCFGGSGVEGEFTSVDDAGWLGAWAPGGKESLVRDGYGVPLDAGSRIVMQVHYNLLAGDSPDTSATQIRWRPRAAELTALHTMLLPAPVELPCRPEHDDGPLCNREAAVEDAKARFGEGPGQLANVLHILCGTRPDPTETMVCTREVRRPMTILGAAGHMHLLGRWIKLQTNIDTPDERTVLDIPEWDFDNQGAKPVRAVHLEAGDTVTVTCHHEQDLRDLLPAFEGQQEKYVVWAEGTTDEMCLGILQVVYDDEVRAGSKPS